VNDVDAYQTFRVFEPGLIPISYSHIPVECNSEALSTHAQDALRREPVFDIPICKYYVVFRTTVSGRTFLDIGKSKARDREERQLSTQYAPEPRLVDTS
jgi:hypothetical protein